MKFSKFKTEVTSGLVTSIIRCDIYQVLGSYIIIQNSKDITNPLYGSASLPNTNSEGVKLKRGDFRLIFLTFRHKY